MPSTLRKVKLSDTVARELLVLIRNGTYPSGTRLPAERELSAHFGVSRASLRDAFRQPESGEDHCVALRANRARIERFRAEGQAQVIALLSGSQQRWQDSLDLPRSATAAFARDVVVAVLTCRAVIGAGI